MDDIGKRNRQGWNRRNERDETGARFVDAETVVRAERGDRLVLLHPVEPIPRDWFGGAIAGRDLPGAAVCAATRAIRPQ